MEAKTFDMICHQGTMDGPITLTDITGPIILHKLQRNVAYAPPSEILSDLSRAGIYTLVGQEKDAELVYVGEGHDVKERLKAHKKNEWWNTVYVFNNNGVAMGPDVRKYIESKIINHESIQRYRVTNTQKNYNDDLSTSAKINANKLLREIIAMCDVISFKLFVPIESRTSKPSSNEPIFILKGKKHVGSMQVRGDKFVVLAGSVLSPVSAKLNLKKIKEMRKASYTDGQKLTEEVSFDSPSAAGAFVCGSNINGRGEWIDADSKKTLAQWQDNE